MVIQRIQTLWLLIAAGMMAALYIRPIAWSADKAVFLSDFPVLTVINVLIAMLLIISIFTFKNLKLQKTVTRLSLVMMAVIAVAGGFFLYRNAPDATLEWAGGIVLLVIAAIFDLLALRGMSRDERKLRNADRLWQ